MKRDESHATELDFRGKEEAARVDARQAEWLGEGEADDDGRREPGSKKSKDKEVDQFHA